ncbi:Reverse transcriptase (RNA-dependent DNA polymerase) [Popillia japonica]|uniref:RNA-directed DNA polymerase n=1 Tax=Popillia japonica TaxID=7064 RepID=A0AAW1LST1_POPJA
MVFIPMVVTAKKDGKNRICTVEETLGKIQDGNVFLKLDCSSGFYQLQLTKESFKYTTFTTPFGKFAYQACPFGISSGPEIFQRTLHNIIHNSQVKGVVVHADDIVVSGRNVTDHDKKLEIVLKTLRDNGVTLNLRKCEFRKTQIQYLGYIVSKEGIQPDPANIESIINFPEPKCVTEVRRFLGLVTYLTKFIKDYSAETRALRELLHKDTQFVWGQSQQKIFNDIKILLTTVPTLAAYNEHYPTRISTDSSSYGVGGVLKQLQPDSSWRPISYCLKSNSIAEQKYAQIEKEALPIAYTCKRFNQYLLGKQFEIRTDHKPLVQILTTKPINDLSARLQLLRLKRAIYNYSVTYVPGKELSAPDALSRAPLLIGMEDEEMLSKFKTINTIATIQNSNIEEENTLEKIKEYVQKRWPARKNCRPDILPYYKHRDYITIVDNMLTYQDRIIIPPHERKQCLKEIHSGHLSLNKNKAKAKETVWWPAINQQIIDMVNNCEECIRDSNMNHVEPMLPFSVEALPWICVGTDLFEFRAKKYLVVQDYYSKYLEVVELKSTKETRSKELEKDDRVWITNEKKEGIVKRKIGTRSYLVETEIGNDIKRKRYHLKKLPDKDMVSRIETENKKNNSIRRSSAQTGVSYGSTEKVLKKVLRLHLCTYKAGIHISTPLLTEL